MKNNQLDKKCRFFGKKLIKWHLDANRREMPWKGEKDPYRVWLSEIILQQTRVEQGRAYYERFLKRFPDIFSLARAPEQAVLKCWEGLGYYTRCRNLIHTAKHIVKEYRGVFPGTYEEILQLKGVGPYTAAAIASFAFDQPYAVVDGNVFRVLSRYHGIDTPIDRPEGKKIFQELAQVSLGKQPPAMYNQALMDFGATICKPQSPGCAGCPMKQTCIAHLEKRVDELPIKSPAKSKRVRWFYYLVPSYNETIPLRPRTDGDVWAGLWEMPLIETNRPLRLEALQKQMTKEFPAEWPPNIREWESVSIRQVLSHQEIHACFLRCRLPKKPRWGTTFKWVDQKQRTRIPFPKIIQDFWAKTE